MLKLMNYKLLVKDNLKEFTFTNRERLTGNCFFLEFVPFIYCPGKERESKNILVSFRYD